tara:strand:- start:1991 stop:2341 length:351 start_codon:yes stop_codon:yes gene_type:complete
MIKYLFFQNDSVDTSSGINYPNDSALLPASNLVDMQISADGTDLTLSFDSLLQSKGVDYEIVLSITEDTGRVVMEAIAEEIAFGDEPFITIADEHNSEFIHADITAVETTLDGSFQ